MQRINSGEVMQPLPENAEKQASYMNGHAHPTKRRPYTTSQRASSGIIPLVICVGGIYASFLTWGLLQERITTTKFEPEPSALHPAPAHESFKFPIFLNTIQSLFAFISGTIYLLTTATSSSNVLPSRAALSPLLLIAITQTLASPFGYASLAHVDYLTFVLAKSCKLLPLMFLHVTFYRKRYPLSKYLIVAAVTAGVAIFTLYHPPKAGKRSSAPAKSSYYGLSLLGINLLFDGLTNTTQDHIFSSPARYGRVTSSQMMAITNFYATIIMSAYLLLTPHIPTDLLPAMAQTSNTHELFAAIAFLQRHPSVLYDVLGFALCGAVGQLFIFATLERFSSLLLVTVTVTRKMLTMVLSVVWYGKSLTSGQWSGVALVFGGIGTEAYIGAQEKRAKQNNKAVTMKTL
jgi:solute carrier family 35 (UDP-galactose transporter), member B1